MIGVGSDQSASERPVVSSQVEVLLLTIRIPELWTPCFPPKISSFSQTKFRLLLALLQCAWRFVLRSLLLYCFVCRSRGAPVPLLHRANGRDPFLYSLAVALLLLKCRRPFPKNLVLNLQRWRDCFLAAEQQCQVSFWDRSYKNRRLRVSFVRPQAPGVVALARSSLRQR